MFEFLFKIWWMIAILPFVVFLEGSKMFANLLKKKDIYQDWDVWHSAIVVLLIAVLILWSVGFR